jgi:uncharacterized protein YndB with AHSA1/START domain
LTDEPPGGPVAERTRGYAHRIDINAPPELVWRALIDQELVAIWCGSGARVTARAGGGYAMRLNGELEREALIDVFDAGRRLRLIYMPPRGLPESEAVMVDDFILDTEQGVAVLRLLGSGFPQDEGWESFYVRLRAAWALALARLKVCVEQLARGKEPGKLQSRSAP